MSDDDSMLSNLSRLIPGYGAYREQESRREDDRRTRQFLSKRLADCKARLDAVGKQAVKLLVDSRRCLFSGYGGVSYLEIPPE